MLLTARNDMQKQLKLAIERAIYGRAVPWPKSQTEMNATCTYGAPLMTERDIRFVNMLLDQLYFECRDAEVRMIREIMRRDIDPFEKMEAMRIYYDSLRGYGFFSWMRSWFLMISDDLEKLKIKRESLYYT
jgi:hypothetical protein